MLLMQLSLLRSHLSKPLLKKTQQAFFKKKEFFLPHAQVTTAVAQEAVSMEPFQAGALKVEKAYANLRCEKLHKLGCFFRVMEISLFFIFFWTNRKSTQFPVTVKFFTGEYFHELLLNLSSPRIVFLIGNAIILILFADSRQNLANDGLNPNPDLYDEYTQNIAKKLIVKEKTCPSEKLIQVDCVVPNAQKLRTYKRSKSEMCRKTVRKQKAELRRSATENCRQLIRAGKAAEEGEGDKGMSDDEFRDMVEAFIARQQRNLREE